MRQIFESHRATVTSSAEQIKTAERPLVLAATFSARESNAGNLYLVGSSTITSSEGLEFVAGKERHFSYEPGGVTQTTFWVRAASSNDFLDYTWLLED